MTRGQGIQREGMLFLNLPGTGPPSPPSPPKKDGAGEGAACNFFQLHSIFTQDLPLRGDNYVIE